MPITCRVRRRCDSSTGAHARSLTDALQAELDIPVDDMIRPLLRYAAARGDRLTLETTLPEDRDMPDGLKVPTLNANHLGVMFVDAEREGVPLLRRLGTS